MIAFPILIFSLFDILSFKGDFCFSTTKRSCIRKDGWNNNSSTHVCKTYLIVFSYNSKSSVTYIIRSIVNFIYLEQFFSLVVYADYLTLSITHKAY